MPSCISSASMCDNICACTSTNLEKKLSNYIFLGIKKQIMFNKEYIFMYFFCKKTNIVIKTNNKI